MDIKLLVIDQGTPILIISRIHHLELSNLWNHLVVKLFHVLRVVFNPFIPVINCINTEHRILHYQIIVVAKLRTLILIHLLLTTAQIIFIYSND